MFKLKRLLQRVHIRGETGHGEEQTRVDLENLLEVNGGGLLLVYPEAVVRGDGDAFVAAHRFICVRRIMRVRAFKRRISVSKQRALLLGKTTRSETDLLNEVYYDGYTRVRTKEKSI